VLARGLLARLGARHEAMPIQHALAIVVSAANRVHAAHLAGTRLYTTPETTLVRFDGVVDVEASPAPGADGRADVTALGRLLADLVNGSDIPPGLAAAFASAIDVEDGPASAAELARALAFAAREAKIKLSRSELGKWARRQVHPPKLAHTLRRDDVPELGVDLGALKPKPKVAEGSGEHDGYVPGDETGFLDDNDEVTIARRPRASDLAALSLTPAVPVADDADDDGDGDGDDAEAPISDADLDVATDDLIEQAVAPSAMKVVQLPVLAPPRKAPRSIGTAIVALLAVALILAAAGWVIFYDAEIPGFLR
jgi:hypothetical protein